MSFKIKLFGFFLIQLTCFVYCEDFVHNPIQYHRQNPRSGSYNYGYDTGLFGSHSFHMENKDASSGQVRGRYGYTDPDGKLRLTYYTAGPQGFNVVPDTSKPTSAAPSYRTDSHTTTTVVEAPLVRVDHHPVPLPVHDVPVSHLSRPISPCTINKPPCPRGMLSRKEFLD